MVYVVSRIFTLDFIYLDLLFCLIWIIILIRKKYYFQLLTGLFGFCVVFFTDDVIWYLRQGVRQFHEIPFNEHLFLLYLSFTYGMIEFSYVAVMFSARNWKKMLFWTSLLFVGWFTIGFLSKFIHLDDRVIHISRDMAEAGNRWSQLALTLAGYLALIILKYTWKPFKNLTWLKLGYLFLVGFLVHFAMEITLLSAGIRPLAEGSFGVLIFNSLIEFNMGIPPLFFGWIMLKDRTVSTGREEEKISWI